MGLGQAEICFCLLEPGGAGGRLELGPHQRILGLQVHVVFIDVVQFALRLQHLLLQILHHLKRAAMLGENADEEGDDAEECLAGWRLLWLSQLAQVGVHVGHLLADHFNQRSAVLLEFDCRFQAVPFLLFALFTIVVVALRLLLPVVIHELVEPFFLVPIRCQVDRTRSRLLDRNVDLLRLRPKVSTLAHGTSFAHVGTVVSWGHEHVCALG